MGAAAMLKPIGYCCSFLSLFGVILLGCLYAAEKSYTDRLGKACPAGGPTPCTLQVQHDNQDDAANAWCVFPLPSDVDSDCHQSVPESVTAESENESERVPSDSERVAAIDSAV